ncbi:phage portal protein [Clostridium perfringens]
MLTLEQAKSIYQSFVTTEKVRLQKLFNYYNAKHDILTKVDRTDGDTSRIVNNYSKYISTIATGYFIGNPIKYSSTDEDLEEINNIFKLNYETSHNADLALNMSIFGKAYELNYLDENSRYNFASIDPRTVIVIKDGSLKDSITDAIIINERNIPQDNKVEITLSTYDNTKCVQYKAITDTDAFDCTFNKENEFNHNMGCCPIIEYKNNAYSKSDFEDVITLIDAYNEAISTSIDDLKDFTDAFLKLKNLSGTDLDDIKQIKDSKVIMVDGDGDADWLIKNINDVYSENIKNRLKHDIHKFAFCPDLTDEAFAGNVTGIAIKCKFQALEQLRQEKERYFTKGLMHRFDMINTYLSKYGKNLDILSLNISFQANLPVNTAELINNLVSLSGTISRKTQLSNIPFVKDVDSEIKQLKQEKNTIYNDEELDFNKGLEDE